MPARGFVSSSRPTASRLRRGARGAGSLQGARNLMPLGRVVVCSSAQANGRFVQEEGAATEKNGVGAVGRRLSGAAARDAGRRAPHERRVRHQSGFNRGFSANHRSVNRGRTHYCHRGGDLLLKVADLWPTRSRGAGAPRYKHANPHRGRAWARVPFALAPTRRRLDHGLGQGAAEAVLLVLLSEIAAAASWWASAPLVETARGQAAAETGDQLGSGMTGV